MIIQTNVARQTQDGEVVSVVEFDRINTKLDNIIEAHAKKAKKLLEKALKTQSEIRFALSDLEELPANFFSSAPTRTRRTSTPRLQYWSAASWRRRTRTTR